EPQGGYGELGPQFTTPIPLTAPPEDLVAEPVWCNESMPQPVCRWHRPQSLAAIPEATARRCDRRIGWGRNKRRLGRAGDGTAFRWSDGLVGVGPRGKGANEAQEEDTMEQHEAPPHCNCTPTRSRPRSSRSHLRFHVRPTPRSAAALHYRRRRPLQRVVLRRC